MSIRVTYSDFHVDEYDSENEAESNILEAHAEGVGVESVTDTNDESKIYSLIWGVKLQRKSNSPLKDGCIRRGRQVANVPHPNIGAVYAS